MFAIVALTLAAEPVQAAPPPACTAARPADCVAGSWTGALVGTDWTFEFTRENGGWAGRYMTARGGKWQPLRALAIADGSLSFDIASTPTMTFRLTLDRAADTLTGYVEVAGHRALDFSAARKR